MKRFDQIRAAAIERHGEDDLLHYLTMPLPPDELSQVPDDRFLSAMAFAAFAAGFRWRVIDAKWDGFEDAFGGFEPSIVADFDDNMIEGLRNDRRIVRNPQKIVATIENARFVRDTSAEHGGFGSWVAQWPDDDIVGLWAALKAGGSRLGGHTGPRALRIARRDTFILTADVEHALREMGAMTASGSSAKGLRQANAAFAQWQQESGRTMAEISMTLARSIDRPRDDDEL